MAIKGLTERKRMPRLGKIHLGIKMKNDKGVEYPRAVDYFVCPPEVQKVFGEKPKELRIMIPVEDEEKWASQFYHLYSRTRGLVCKGDGERAMRLVDAETGDLTWKDDAKAVVMKGVECRGRDCPDYGVKCKEIMNMQFLLPEVPGLGIWQIDTGSINSIMNINSGADFIRRLYGRLALLPLLLTVEPQVVKTPEGKQKTVWVLNLRTREKLGDLMQMARLNPAEILALPEPEETELPVPDDEIPAMIIPQNQEPKSKTVEATVLTKPVTRPQTAAEAFDNLGKKVGTPVGPDLSHDENDASKMASKAKTHPVGPEVSKHQTSEDQQTQKAPISPGAIDGWGEVGQYVAKAGVSQDAVKAEASKLLMGAKIPYLLHIGSAWEKMPDEWKASPESHGTPFAFAVAIVDRLKAGK